MRKYLLLTPIISLFAVLLIVVGCISTQENTLERNKDIVHRVHEEIWNKGNLDIIDELYSNETIWHLLPLGVELKGRDELKDRIRKHRQAFPDWAENIQQTIAEGDLVANHFKSTGTNKGSFLGNAPTGKQIHINEMSIYRIVDGKIVETWVIPDILSLKQQLGLISK